MSKSKKTGIGQLNIVKTVFACLLISFLAFATSERLDSPVDAVIIEIKARPDMKKLIDEDEVRLKLKQLIGYDISISNNEGLDLQVLERGIEEDNRIEQAEIFMDKRNRIHVLIFQKNPVVRVEVTGGEDYYLDRKGQRIPMIEGQIIRVPIVTGHIDPFTPGYREEAEHNLNVILEMAQKLSDDEFLSALVEQIHIDRNDEIVLIPKMGRTRIMLGQIENLDEKMYKLKTYYKKGIKHIGIDRFEELNMEYEGQVLGISNS